MGIRAWIRNLFRGKPAVDGRRVPILNRFAEIEDHLRSNRRAEAEASCRQLALLLVEWPGGDTSTESQFFLAMAHFILGSFYRDLGKKEEGEKAFGQALQLWQTLAAAHPGDAQYVGQLAACKNHLGLLYLDAGLLQQAEGYFQEGLAIRERLFASHPGDEENRVFLGGILCNLGIVAAGQSQWQTALDYYHRSIDLLDRSIPGCDCGCRDLHANLIAAATGRPSPVLTAQQYLANALHGRASVLTRENPDQRYRQVSCDRRGNCLVVSLLAENLGNRGSGEAAPTLSELKRELLDVVCSAPGPYILDLQAVQAMDPEGAALLLHLRSRLVGGGEWPALCGLSDALRAATPSVPWDKNFTCYATVEAALAALGR